VASFQEARDAMNHRRDFSALFFDFTLGHGSLSSNFK
jgi:hypothetical protein